MSALDAAERKGRDAALAGLTEDHCPYKDRRTDRGAITWSRSFIRAWLKGFREENKRDRDDAEAGGEDPAEDGYERSSQSNE